MAPDLRQYDARGGTRSRFPALETLRSDGNMRHPGRSCGCTVQSVAKSVDIAHTSFLPNLLQFPPSPRGRVWITDPTQTRPRKCKLCRVETDHGETARETSAD